MQIRLATPQNLLVNNVIRLQKTWDQSLDRLLVHLRANIDRQPLTLTFTDII